MHEKLYMNRKMINSLWGLIFKDNPRESAFLEYIFSKCSVICNTQYKSLSKINEIFKKLYKQLVWETINHYEFSNKNFKIIS